MIRLWSKAGKSHKSVPWPTKPYMTEVPTPLSSSDLISHNCCLPSTPTLCSSHWPPQSFLQHTKYTPTSGPLHLWSGRQRHGSLPHFIHVSLSTGISKETFLNSLRGLHTLTVYTPFPWFKSSDMTFSYVLSCYQSSPQNTCSSMAEMVSSVRFTGGKMAMNGDSRGIKNNMMVSNLDNSTVSSWPWLWGNTEWQIRRSGDGELHSWCVQFEVD